MSVALTEIRYGLTDGTGDVIVVPEGEDPSKYDLPQDVVDELTENGTIGEAPISQAQADADKAELEAKNDELAARVAELEAALAAAKEPKK